MTLSPCKIFFATIIFTFPLRYLIVELYPVVFGEFVNARKYCALVLCILYTSKGAICKV